MPYFCHKCAKELSGIERGKAGRRDSCPACGSDLHCCLNCNFYDKTAYNDCREPQADRVVDKNSSNFCDFFTFAETGSARGGKSQAKDPLKALDDLFKK